MNRPKLVVILVAVCLLAAMALSSCGSSKGKADGKSESKETLSGSAKSVGEKLISTASEGAEALGFPEYFDREVKADEAKGMFGLETADFEKYVSEATVFTAAINTTASEVAIAKCKSAKDAEAVKELVAKGFDPAKWICVMPERCVVVESGSYVLLFVGTAGQMEKMQTSFAKLAEDNVGKSNVFFEDSVSEDQGGGVKLDDGSTIGEKPAQ